MPTFVGGKKLESRCFSLSNTLAISGFVSELPLFTVMREEFKKGIMLRKIMVKTAKSTSAKLVFNILNNGFQTMPSLEVLMNGSFCSFLDKIGCLMLPDESLSIVLPVEDLPWVNVTILFSEN